MASERKLAANRRNAQKSTGPRTTAGKARTRRNAYRHGLAIPVTRDVLNAELVALVASQLVGKSASQAEQEHALLAAEFQVEGLRAQQAKVDLLNRAGCRHVAAGDTFDQVMAVGFASELEALAILEGYQERARSKRKRMLQALAAAERANLAYERRVNVFLEPVARLDISEAVRAALVSLQTTRRSGKASREIYTGAFDLGASGRAEVFVQWHDAASGVMSVRISGAGQEIPKQVFTIVTRPARIAGDRWVAICPATGQTIANLYVQAGGGVVKSRHALNLHYRSKNTPRAKGKRQHLPGIADYATIVALMAEPPAKGGTVAANNSEEAPATPSDIAENSL
jgi:hypothetical protein